MCGPCDICQICGYCTASEAHLNEHWRTAIEEAKQDAPTLRKRARRIRDLLRTHTA